MMKKTTKILFGALVFFVAGASVAGGLASSCKAQPRTVAVPTGGYVDLTQAAESSVNAVVYIKVTQNSKTKTVDVQDPFSDFFGDFFGFGGGRQQRQIQTPKREGSGSGVIISSDG